MDSSSPHAVFLSYAREDTAAAECIAEGLRRHGVEVWFDQKQLRGGDAWDAAIRGQIKACALFVPLISRHAEKRLEGYFRLEWRLADQRTHLMAKARPFLVPIVVDDTPNAQATVPDSFLDVQWTRLPGGVTTPEFIRRIQDLLAGSTAPALAGAPVSGAPAPGSDSKPRRRRRSLRAAGALVLAVAVLVALLLRRRGMPHSESAPSPVSGAPAADTPSIRPSNLKRALDLLETLGATAENFRVAEEMIRTEWAKHPDDPDAVLAMARVSNAFLNRGFDVSEARMDQSRHYSEMAMQLAPERAESKAELAQSLALTGSDFSRAEELIRQAIAAEPDNARYHRMLDYDVLAQGPGKDRAVKSAEQTAARFPRDFLSQYQLSLIYRRLGKIDEAERAINAAVALATVSSAEDWRVRFLLWRHGDLDGSLRVLRGLPTDVQTNPRIMMEYVQCGCLSGQAATTEAALDVVGRVPGSWIEDFVYAGPKALLLAELYEAEGKSAAAQVMFGRAKADIAQHEATDLAPNAVRTKVWILLGLGQKEEAAFLARAFAQQNDQALSTAVFYPWWLAPAPMEFLAGNPDVAVKWMRQISGYVGGRDYLRTAFRLDRRMAPFRTQPEVVALLGGSLDANASAGKVSH